VCFCGCINLGNPYLAIFSCTNFELIEFNFPIYKNLDILINIKVIVYPKMNISFIKYSL